MFKNSLRVGMSLLVLSMSSVFAVSSEFTEEMMSREDAVNNGVYAQADLGASNGPWRHNFPRTGFISNNEWGFGYAGAVGYQWSPFLAAEVGAFFMPAARFRINGVATSAKSWAVDAAGKIIVPIPRTNNLDAFFKAGIAYRDTKIGGILRVHGDWRPLFAAGGQYNFTRNWFMEAQWAYLGEASVVSINGSSPNNIPAYNLFTLGVGYKFTF